MNSLTILLIVFIPTVYSAEELQSEPNDFKILDIGCMNLISLEDLNIIYNDQEYQKILEHKVSRAQCTSFELPYIDFNEFNLIGFTTNVGGCKDPNYAYTLNRIADEQYQFMVHINAYGICRRGYTAKHWILLKKVIDPKKVSFEHEIRLN